MAWVSTYWPELIGALTGVLGVFGVARKLQLRPRQLIYRLAGFISAAKERELLLISTAEWETRAKNEEKWKNYWKTQAQQCISQFQQEFHAEAERERAHDSPAGGGHISSAPEAGRNLSRRWTG